MVPYRTVPTVAFFIFNPDYTVLVPTIFEFRLPVFGDGAVSDVVANTPVFMVVQLQPPVFLHGAKDCDVQGLGQVGRVGGEEDVPVN